MYSLILLLSICITGCKKFLDHSPDKNLVVPSTLADLKSLMSNSLTMNFQFGALGEASADNYYLTYETWQALKEGDRNTYIWGPELFFDNPAYGYQYCYEAVYYTNVILETLEQIPKNSDNRISWNSIKGEALFFRAQYFQVLASYFSNEYDPSTASKDLGIPLRLSSDFNIKSVRSSVQQTYDQIISDLKTAITLLPVTPSHVIHPSKPAAYGLLSRVYLSMRRYDKALLYADSCLALENELLDYNILDSAGKYPFPLFNREVVFHAGDGSSILSRSTKIDSTLIRSYADNDLRKTLYFKENSDGSYSFRGSYCQSGSRLFQGIATDELYLIQAECLARSEKISESMEVLNKLLATRWRSGTFIAFTAENKEEALTIILSERRKELVMRNLRWMDLKRLNKETDHQITIRRMLNKKEYILKPNDPRYALPLPQYIIDLTGMRQNPRE